MGKTLCKPCYCRFSRSGTLDRARLPKGSIPITERCFNLDCNKLLLNESRPHYIHPNTTAGGQDWSPFFEQSLCNSCYMSFLHKGSLLPRPLRSNQGACLLCVCACVLPLHLISCCCSHPLHFLRFCSHPLYFYTGAGTDASEKEEDEGDGGKGLQVQTRPHPMFDDETHLKNYLRTLKPTLFWDSAEVFSSDEDSEAPAERAPAQTLPRGPNVLDSSK